jgi:hypothetical protein
MRRRWRPANGRVDQDRVHGGTERSLIRKREAVFRVHTTLETLSCLRNASGN